VYSPNSARACQMPGPVRERPILHFPIHPVKIRAHSGLCGVATFRATEAKRPNILKAVFRPAAHSASSPPASTEPPPEPGRRPPCLVPASPSGNALAGRPASARRDRHAPPRPSPRCENSCPSHTAARERGKELWPDEFRTRTNWGRGEDWNVEGWTLLAVWCGLSFGNLGGFVGEGSPYLPTQESEEPKPQARWSPIHTGF
jgi:hypothetical protein